jgi:hypothetical protein
MKVMTRKGCLVCSCFALGVLVSPNSSFADYIGAGGIPVRIHDDGTTAPPSYDSFFFPLVEEPADSVALTDNQQKVYGLANTLGFANYVLVWDANTGQRLPADFLALGPNTLPPSDNNYIGTWLGHNQPLIRGSQLFALSPVYPGGYTETNNWQIKRFNINSHSLVEVINPPTTQHLDDIALDSSGLSLYAAGTSGLYRYTYDIISGSYGAVPPVLLIPGVDGNIAVGPTGLIYVRNFANGDVQRYTAAGTFLDTFISHTTYPNLGTIQFGTDGNLHAYQGGSPSKILKFTALTGSLLSSTPNSLNNGRITYLVPEPQNGMLLCVGSALLLTRRRTKVFRRG